MKLSNDEIVKWACLFECLYNVNEVCDKKGLNVDYILKKKVKLNVMQEYMRERYPIMCNQLETGEYAGDFIEKFVFGSKI
jgi:hypothetical protein